MIPGRWGTHAVELGTHRVIKRFHRTDRGSSEREWRALNLLAQYAPGLAPVPCEADLTAETPVVVMSRLPGEPLRGRAIDAGQIEALVAAVYELHAAVPPDVLTAKSPLRPGHQEELVAQLHIWARLPRHRCAAEVARAMDRGLAWLADAGLEAADLPDVPPVFGAGDGNLANYLWDGACVRIIDFEDSGRSDRAFELAEITEHVGSWVEQPLDVASLLSRFSLTEAESVRLGECRRLLALVWLFLLSFDEHNRRNPPGTAERQARRLNELLP